MSLLLKQLNIFNASKQKLLHSVFQNHTISKGDRDPYGSWHPTPSLAPHRTTQKSNPVSESIVQKLLELLGASSAWARGCALRPLVPTLSLTLFPAPSLAQLHAVSSGPVAVTESRAQRCPSAPCEELQLPWGLPSAPLLCAEQTQGPQPLLIRLPLQTFHRLHVLPVDAL